MNTGRSMRETERGLEGAAAHRAYAAVAICFSVAASSTACGSGSLSTGSPQGLNQSAQEPGQVAPSADSAEGLALHLGSGIVAMIAPKGDGSSLEAQLSGTVVDVDGECLGLSSGASTSVLVFEYGTRVSTDGQGVLTPQGVQVNIGDRVRGGGGGFAWDASQVPPADSTLPQACYALGASSAITNLELRP